MAVLCGNMGGKMPDVSSLYPQPPHPQASGGGLLSDPSALFSLMRAGQEFQAKQSVGQAFQQSLGPEGVDTGKAAGIIANDPNAALAAPEASLNLLEQRRRQTDLATANMGMFASSFAPLAAKGKKVTMDDVHNAMTATARINPQAAPLMNAYFAGMNPQNASDYVQRLGNYAQGAGAALAPIDYVHPQTLQPGLISRGSTVGAGFTPSGAAPGVAGRAQAQIEQFTADQGRSNAIGANLRNIKEAYQLAQPLSDDKFGPLSQGWTNWLARASELGLVSPQTDSQISARQQLGARLQAYAGQFRTADRSDAALHNVIASKPDPAEMIKPATLDAIRSQYGKDVVDQAMPEIYRRGLGDHVAGQGSDYTTYRGNYYQSMHDQAGEWDLLSKADKQKLVNSLGGKDSDAYKKFVKTHDTLRRAGAVGQPQPSQ